jgi:rhodanese-related sulfurtransferase
MSADNMNLSPEEFAEGVKTHSDAIILDVRTPEEFNSGHLPGAVNINIQGYDFHEQIEDLDASRPYYVYCRSGARSATACRYMQSKGFTDVHNLLGGILAWEGEVQ